MGVGGKARNDGQPWAKRKGDASELEIVDELAEYMKYCCMKLENWESQVAGKLVACHSSMSSGWGNRCR